MVWFSRISLDLHTEARRLAAATPVRWRSKPDMRRSFSGGFGSNGGAEFASPFLPVHPVTGCELDTRRRRAPSLCLILAGNRWFESISLQRRVTCEPEDDIDIPCTQRRRSRYQGTEQARSLTELLCLFLMYPQTPSQPASCNYPRCSAGTAGRRRCTVSRHRM